MSLSRTCLFLFALATSQTTHAQSTTYIVKLKPNTAAMSYETQNQVRLTEISRDLGLWEAQPVESVARGARAATVAQSKNIEYAVPNYPVQWRTVASPVLPNDPLLNQQWSLLLDNSNVGIGATEAWKEFGTGGRDKSGNDIVVAIVDGGFDYNHSDLASNRWINRAEKAGNGKDDDGNGYVDDINGWNARDNNNKIGLEDHGTMVAGIIGARGNNKIGISGINQRVKIMYVSAGSGLGNTATTMRAYTYILKQKQLWLQTKGQKGANIVAINSSFGIDAQKCNQPQFKVWNDMINSLGAVGILSIGATANAHIDVDKDGDIPTSCESEYLIAVTNNRSDGSKYPQAGYGARSIDLAAPGDEILSTTPRLPNSNEPQYDVSIGTSFSTPHVTGAVAYLHSVASLDFNKRYLKDPAAAALELKKVLLGTVTPVPALKGLTVSGGVLNLYEASAVLSRTDTTLATNL